ncbi:MAG: hypothetical protein IJP29_02385 [Lachnospiraceae bacterium]|nr:hypothetical protein [Lachnospiraceae bacterium]
MTKDKKNNQRYIYVLLSRTNTVVATLVRFFTQAPYSHTSISLDPELEHLYSFARRKINNPLTAGFIHEDIEKGVFGSDDSITCKVYRVPVTEEQYKRIKAEIAKFNERPSYYGYNFLGLFAGILRLNIKDERRFTCCAFVDHVLVAGGIHLFDNENKLIKPYDFHNELYQHEMYEGRLCEYRNFLERHSLSENGYAEAI